MAGKRWKLYYNTGTHSSPVWAEVVRARDIKMPRGKGAADGSRRESEFEIEETALKTIGLEFGYVYKKGTDAVRDVFQASYDDGTKIQFAVADGEIATSGTKYTKFWGEVSVWDIDAPLKGDDLIPAKVIHAAEDNADPPVFHEPELVIVGTT
jgi:hypothetical protein